ncbi:hypothetical protein BH23CHL8_BH23CHL8_18830 [soil metagenome]
MAVLSKTLRPKYFVSVRDRNGTAQGNGGGVGDPVGGGEKHIPIGRSPDPENPTISEAVMRWGGNAQGGAVLPAGGSFWSGVRKLVKAQLWLRTTDNEQHVAKGANPDITVRRVTASWNIQPGNGEGNWSAGYPTKTPPASTGTGAVTKQHGNGGGKWRAVDITDIVGATAPSTVLLPDGTPGTGATEHGVLIRSTSPGGTAATIEYVSPLAETWLGPYIELTYLDNLPPLAPVITSPVTQSGGGPGPPASTNADRLTVVGTAAEQDTGQAVPTQQVQVHADSATDETPSVPPIQDVTFTGLQNDFSVTLPGGVLVPRRDYRHRVRSRDAGGDWGPWTSLADGRFRPSYQPGVPAAPYFTPYGTSGNLIYASLVSPNPADYVTAHETEVYEDPPAAGRITKWASGEQSIGGTSQRAEVAYGGSQLLIGRTYRWYMRLANSDGVWSPFTAWQFVTPVEVVGPDALSPRDTSVKQTSRTPTLTVGNSAAFDAHQVRLYSETGELLHDSGLRTHSSSTSQPFVVPLGLLEWGDEPRWEAAVRLTGAGDLGPFSPRYPFRINHLPGVPGITLEAPGGSPPTGPVLPTLDPLVRAPYVDDDVARYGEVPDGQELMIRAAATPVGSGAMVERRETNVDPLVAQAIRVGRSLDLLTSATGWATDTAVTATTAAQQPTGYSGNSLEIQATGGSSTDRGARKTLAIDPSAYGGGALLRIHRRVTSSTNLVRWVIRFEFATTGAWVEYELFPAGAALNTWAEVAIRLETWLAEAGTINWGAISAIRLFADVSGAYTGNLQVRDLRIGTTRTAKTTPDGHLVPESSYDFRVRYKDDAAIAGLPDTFLAASASAGATNVKYTAGTFTVGMDVRIGTFNTNRETLRVTAVGTSGAGGTGLTLDDPLSFAHASGEILSGRLWGPWSGWRTAKVSLPPVVAASTPADAAVLADPTPDLVHTYSSPGGKAQARVLTRIYLRGTDDALIWEGEQTGTSLTRTLPRFLLTSGKTYAWEKQAFDSDGLSGTTTRRAFTLTVGAIADITGLVATADPGSGSVGLAWDTSTAPFLDHYRVYWKDASGAWVRVDGGPATLEDGRVPLTAPAFTHYGARLGLNEYAVTAHIGASPEGPAESALDAATAEATRESQEAGRWTLVVPESSVLELRVVGAPRERSAQVEALDVPGRGETVHLHYGRGRRRVSVEIQHRPVVDGDWTRLLEVIMDAGLAGYLGPPAGWQMDPWYVRILALGDAVQVGGMLRSRIELETTALP